MAPKSPFRILFSRGSIRTVETIGFIRLFKEDQNRDDTLRKTSENALEQIRDRKYFHGLKGDVLMHGIAVRGKDVLVSSDTMSL